MAATPLEASYHRAEGVRMTSIESVVPCALLYEEGGFIPHASPEAAGREQLS
jgi:hypothetical protein